MGTKQVSEFKKNLEIKTHENESVKKELDQAKKDLKTEREIMSSDDNEQTKKLQAQLAEVQKKCKLVENRWKQEKTKVESLTNERDHLTENLEDKEKELNEILESGENSNDEKLIKRIKELETE